MKIKSVKKVLTATLMATMLMASTLTAAAAGTAASSGAGTASSSGAGSGSTSKSESESEADNKSEVSSAESSDSDGGSVAAVTESVAVSSAGATVRIAGVNIKTTIAGAVAATSVQGVAVVTPLDTVKASLGLQGSETPYIMVFDTNAQKSPLAMECVNTVAKAIGGEYVTAVNVTLGAKNNGQLVSLSNGSAAMMVGLPKQADTSKTYSVVCVQPKGIVTILEDQDTNPATVTFEIKAGLGTYALIAK